MRPRTSSRVVAGLALAAFILVMTPLGWAGSTYQVLHAFRGKPDGGGLYDRLAMDPSGNLYGTTWGGGANGYGSVFEVAADPDGKWTEAVLYSFCSDPPLCTDGDLPSNGITLDSAGNLYGSTRMVFRLVPGFQRWDYSVIYNQGSSGDMVVDGKGNLYGAIGFGKCNGGEILKLKPQPDDTWIAKDLYDFCVHNGKWSKGNSPAYGLNWDAAGNLYGVTSAGGKHNFGVVFELEHAPGGWKERVLHHFALDGRDGFYPYAGVVVDSAFNVYGSTLQGGSERCGGAGCGTIYRLTQQPDGHWKETILYRFPKLRNGAGPSGTLALDAAGNLYGVAGGGEGPCGGGGCGVVFKLTHNPDGTWTYEVLHRFQGPDGALPVAGVILDAKGNIYGTTSTGGKGGYGVVFKITP